MIIAENVKKSYKNGAVEVLKGISRLRLLRLLI